MPSAADRITFGPQRDPGAVRAFGFALLVHALLIAALTWGVNWKATDRSVAFEAEIWSSVPQDVAPKLVEAPPPPPPPPEPAPVRPEVKPEAPQPDVDIALEQEKKRKLLQQQQAEVDARKALDKQKADALAKKEKELKAKEDQARQQAANKQAQDKQAADKQAQSSAQKQRQEALNRMMGLAGATGGPTATGTAQRAGGPSASYRARLAALFKRNISFSNADSIEGNPIAIVQVKVAPSGLILSKNLIKSSGVPAWDDAVLRAVDKTERIPLDENGKVVPDFPVQFGPKD